MSTLFEICYKPYIVLKNICISFNSIIKGEPFWLKIGKIVEEILHKVKYISGPKATEKTFKRTLEISKMQIESTMRYDYIPTRMFKIKRLKIPSVDIFICWWEYSQFLTYMHLACNPPILLLFIYSKICPYKNLYKKCLWQHCL